MPLYMLYDTNSHAFIAMIFMLYDTDINGFIADTHVVCQCFYCYDIHVV